MIGPTLFGVPCAQGIYATCSPLATSFERGRKIKMSKPKIAICSDHTRQVAENAFNRLGKGDTVLLIMDSESLDLRQIPTEKSILGIGHLDWEYIQNPQVLPKTTTCLIYSSGT